MYELIASGDFPWVDPPELRLWRTQTDEKGESNIECTSVLERYGPKDYLEVMSAALQGNTVPWSSSSDLQCSSLIPSDRLGREELSIN